MNGTEILFTTIFSLIMVVLILWVGRFFSGGISRRWNKHKAETVDQWQSEGVQFRRGPAGGQFGGLESIGVTRIAPGVGFIALTTKDLRVTRATPSEAWCIPYKQIKGVALQTSFMGRRSKKVPFIVVRFKQGGKADKIGFQVRDYEAWAEELGRYARISVKNNLENG